MGNGIKLGPRATILLVVLLAASAVGILTPTLSNTVSKDVQVTGFAVTVTVDGVPETVAPGDVFRVTATLANYTSGGTSYTKTAYAAAIVALVVYVAGFICSFFLPEPSEKMINAD